MSFRDYMELALYHPDHGYYRAASPRYGRRGDFMTAPSASRWYGEVVSHLVAGIAEEAGPLTLVDAGSGDGSFIRRAVDSMGHSAGRIVRRIVSVESSDNMRRQQRVDLESMPVPFSCVEHISEAGVEGGPVIVHASELFDALPVHRVVARDDRLCELWVGARDGEVHWIERAAPPILEEYFDDRGVRLDTGQIAEVNLEAQSLHRDLLMGVGLPGLALVLDYGYPTPRLYDARGRFGGSIACYREHRLSRDPLSHPGEQDITAHVNWDDLRSVGHEAGWTEVGLWPLAEFLVRAGIEEVMAEAGIGPEVDASADVLTERQEVKRLLDPDGMGSDLKMLIQATPKVAGVIQKLLQVRK